GCRSRTGSSRRRLGRRGRGEAALWLLSPRLHGVAGAAPFGEADGEAARLEAALAKQAHGVVGVDAVGAAAVGDNVPPARQGLRDALECGQRSRDRAGNATGPEFGLGADVEHTDLAAA